MTLTLHVLKQRVNVMASMVEHFANIVTDEPRVILLMASSISSGFSLCVEFFWLF